jgi:transcriptional regulator with XRE-family HTH domain
MRTARVQVPFKNTKKEAVMNINGWVVIERMLHRRNKNQNSLARLLGVSPAAITQIKRGDFQLSAVYLEKIMRYLGASVEEEEEIYTQIIQSRFLDQLASSIFCKLIIIKRQK